MKNTGVGVKIIVYIMRSSIKIVKFGVLGDILVNIVSMHIKSSMRFNYGLVVYIIKPFFILSLIVIKDTGTPIHI